MALVQKKLEIKFPKIKFPKIKLPTFQKLSEKLPPKEYSVAEKFQILCPAWYSVITAESHFKANILRIRYKLAYSASDRCFLGESHHFSSRYTYGFGSSCSECKSIAYNYDTASLACMYGMSQKDLNNSQVIQRLVNHMEECHPNLAKW